MEIHLTNKKTIQITITNVVASFSLAPPPLDLEKIHKAFLDYSTWNKATFNYRVVVLRIKKPKMSFLIYRTGKVICTGAKSLISAKQSANYLLNRMKEAGFDFEKKTEAKIQNIVATLDWHTNLNLEEIIYRSEFHTIYEPEQFPGAIIKIPVSQNAIATVLLFGSGKIVCVGLARIEDISTAIGLLNSKLIEPSIV